MKENLRVLIIEDISSDVELAERELRKVLKAYTLKVVDTENGFLEAIDTFKPDFIISDYLLPGFDGLSALKIRQQRCPFTPFVILTGSVNEETAVECMKAGADDYVIKEHIKHLGQTVLSAMEKKNRETGCKLAEERLKESEEKFRAIFEQAAVGVSLILTKTGEFVKINKKYCDIVGYDAAEMAQKTFMNITHPDDLQQDIDNMKLLVDGKIRSFTMEKRYYHKNGSIVWVRLTVSPTWSIGEEPVYHIAVVEDITDKKKTESIILKSKNKLERLTNKLHANLLGTVTALANTVECRDSYTVGHSRNVSDLACAIAKTMGLNAENIEALEMAGFLHDIGKIAIPLEILSKPLPLSDEEFEVIKKHPMLGYELIKSIDFTLPVAHIILEHHERLDGSGYPFGKKENELLLESKILAVADVVEAMSLARPYRKALGLESAFEEILAHRGTLYDSEAVDICVRLFKKMNFKFKPSPKKNKKYGND